MASRTVAQGARLILDGQTYEAGDKVTLTGEREERHAALLEPVGQEEPREAKAPAKAPAKGSTRTTGADD